MHDMDGSDYTACTGSRSRFPQTVSGAGAGSGEAGRDITRPGPAVRYGSAAKRAGPGKSEGSTIMSSHRSGSTVIPSMRYRNAPAAIDWLCDVLGFERHLVVPMDDGRIAHAQLTHGQGMIMLGSVRDEDGPPDPAFKGAYVVVGDIEPFYERVRGTGSEIVMELEAQEYGGKLFSVQDPEGHVWHVGSYDPWTAQH